MSKTVHGAPPWDNAPTPPLEVFVEALNRNPELVTTIKVGHLRPLLRAAISKLRDLAAEVTRLQQLEVEREEARRVKREYQQDYRDGLRGSRAARAAARQGIR